MVIFSSYNFSYFDLDIRDKKKYKNFELFNDVFEAFFDDREQLPKILQVLDLCYMIKNRIIIFKIKKGFETYQFKWEQSGKKEHDFKKDLMKEELKSMGGEPHTEQLLFYGKADVFCEKLRIAIECGYTPIDRLFEGLEYLNEFWVYPYSKDDIFIFKKGKRWNLYQEKYIKRRTDISDQVYEILNKKFGGGNTNES